MKVRVLRSLYDCAHAHVMGDKIYCVKGYRLGNTATQQNISIKRLQRGTPLIMSICQLCQDFDQHDGEPVPENERGWVKV